MKVFGHLSDIIDLNVMQCIQDNFSSAVGLAFVTVDYKGNPVTKESGFTSFCTKARTHRSLASLCHQCDAHGGLHAAITDKPHIYKCHAGLVDFAVPLIIGGSYYGAVLGGQVRVDQGIDEALDKIVDKQSDWQKDPELLEEYKKIRYLPFEKVQSSVRLLHDVIHYVLEEEYRSHMADQLNQKNMKLLEEKALRLDLEKNLHESELNALYSRINSEFFFNILNIIARLAFIEGAKKTEEVIYNFSDMMRYILSKTKNRVVTLGEEVEHVRKYLEIQKIRLEDRLTYQIEVPERYATVACPFMTFQPIVENALKYAVEPNAKGGSVRIACREDGEDLLVLFQDDAGSIPLEVVESMQEPELFRGDKPGVGLSEVNMRLRSLFGKKYALEAEETAEGTGGGMVKLRLPLRGDIVLN